MLQLSSSPFCNKYQLYIRLFLTKTYNSVFFCQGPIGVRFYVQGAHWGFGLGDRESRHGKSPQSKTEGLRVDFLENLNKFVDFSGVRSFPMIFLNYLETG